MIYPSTFENKLGFTIIREYLRGLCLSPLGQRNVDAMEFISNFTTLNILLQQVSEMKDICMSTATFPTSHYFDITDMLRRIHIIGSFPELQEAFDLLRSLKAIQSILTFFKSSEQKKYKHLCDVASLVQFDKSVIETLDSILNQQGAVRDNASAKLSEIRADLNGKVREVSKRMGRIMKEAQNQGWIDNEALLSIHEGRLVIPILSVNKRKLKGIIHDESATGKTVFIEPEEIVELNNLIRELEHAERREIVLILIHFADSIRPLIDQMLNWYDFLAMIDFVRSKALFAMKVESYLPSLLEKPVWECYGALHPLLYLHLKNEGKPIVPLNLQLNNQSRILVISGPNAGGKSVCLQTVGLLQYMLQCGMLIPVKPASEMGIFNNIFIDIGDEQSIENDLSTYSSRLMNMKYFLKNASSDTLVLIDEFGSGTEPMIGGAIAESILDSLNKKGCFAVITTHYTNLKLYAMNNEGVSNGAMLYDTSQLRPLFELRIGEPGSSFAFEIARKIGLPEDILSCAEQKVGQEHIEFDKNLREIIRDKHYWERKRETIRSNEKRLEQMVDQYSEELENISKLRKETLSKAKQQAEAMLLGVNKQIELTIREIKEAQAEKQRTQESRKNLEHKKQEITQFDLSKEEAITQKIEQIKQQQERRKVKKKLSSEPFLTQEDSSIVVGDTVKFKDNPDMSGEVTELSGQQATVVIGNMKINAHYENLQKISENEIKKPHIAPPRENQIDLLKRRVQYKPRIDVRGYRGDEAMKTITNFIDESIMMGESEVSILHGKGNGILRELIRGYLKTISEVTSFTDAHVEHGGAGITIVQLK